MATLALDADTVLVLRARLARQDIDRQLVEPRWVESGLLFTQEDGSPLHPAEVTEQFRDLTTRAGLPPSRPHDLRHGAATLALAAGVEMKVVQHMQRHASLTTTNDLYTNALTDWHVRPRKPSRRSSPGPRSTFSAPLGPAGVRSRLSKW